MALDPQLLDILACPEDKGPLLYFEDEESLYNPRLKRRYAIRDDIPVMLIDEAETVDDAEHARLLAKAEADGIKPTFERRERLTPTTARSTRSACVEATAALPEQVADADVRARDGVDELARSRRRSRTSSCSAWAAAASPATCWPRSPDRSCRCRSSSSRPTSSPPFVSEGTLVFAISFSGDTEETSRPPSRPRCRAPRSSASPTAASWASLPSRGARRWCRVPTASRCPRAGVGAHGDPAARRARGDRPVPRRRRSGSTRAVDQLRVRRRARSPRDGSEAADLARRIGRTIPLIYGGGCARRGRRPALEDPGATRTPRCPRSATRIPSCATTRSPAGASTATSPVRCSRSSTLRHDHEHPQVMPPVRARAPRCSTRWWPASSRCEAEGDGRAGPALDLFLVGDFVSLHLAAPRGRRPRPRPRPRRAQGRLA